MTLGQLLSFCHFPCYPQANWALLELIPKWVYVLGPCRSVSPKHFPVRLGVSPTTSTLTSFFQSEVLSLYFSTLEPWVKQSVSLPNCSSLFIFMQMLDHPLHQPLPHLVLQPLPCHESSPPGCPSPPLLPIWMNVSSLTPCLLDFHTVQFSVSSGCFFI